MNLSQACPRNGLAGILVMAVALLVRCSTGECSTPGPRLQPSAGLLVLDPGPVGLTSFPQPAAFSFDRARGRVEYAGDGAAVAVQRILKTPHLGQPKLEGAVGVIEFALAPFFAAYGAISSVNLKLSAGALAEAERDLVTAMSAMADQRLLREDLCESAREITRRHFISLDEPSAAGHLHPPASGWLETRVEELRLERTGSGDSSYALRITARARLVNASDGSVIAERPYHYQSGRAMFIDWTRHDGFASVARTAYQEIADQNNLSLDTVRHYIKSLYRKLEINSRFQLVQKINNLL